MTRAAIDARRSLPRFPRYKFKAYSRGALICHTASGEYAHYLYKAGYSLVPVMQ